MQVPHFKESIGPHCCLCSFGCNITDILQEIAYSVREDLCLQGSPVGSKAHFDVEHFVQGNLNMNPQVENK